MIDLLVSRWSMFVWPQIWLNGGCNNVRFSVVMYLPAVSPPPFPPAARGDCRWVISLTFWFKVWLKALSAQRGWNAFPAFLCSLFLIKGGWDWATVQPQITTLIFFFFSASLRFDPRISCKTCLLSRLYCALILAFYITLRHMAAPCVLSSAEGRVNSFPLVAEIEDSSLQSSREEWDNKGCPCSIQLSFTLVLSQCIPSNGCDILHLPCSVLNPQSLSRAQPLFRSCSLSLTHTIGLLSPGPVWCWTLDSPLLPLSLFPFKIHPNYLSFSAQPRFTHRLPV